MVSDSSPAPQDRRAATRMRALLALLVILIAIGIVRLVQGSGPEPLDRRLRGESHDVVAALNERLGPLDESARLRLLLEYVDDSSPNLRYASVDALGNLKRPEAADAIRAAFEDNSSQVRQRAVEVLHQVDRRRGFALLLSALRDEDDWIREAAAMQLMLLLRSPGPEATKAYPVLVAAMDPADPVVCRTAIYALSRVTGKPWRLKAAMSDKERDAVIARWRAWWDKQKTASPYARGPLPEPVRPSRRDPAPDFRIRDLDGKLHSPDSLRGKVILIHFYGVWCAPCDADMRNLAKLDARYAPQGVAMIGVALAPHDKDAVRKWCAERDARFPQALASDAILEAFGHVHEVPVTALIDRNGDLRYRWEGERDIRTYETALDRILAGG